MNKFQKLAQLNKDIELLENAGKIKAANILHKKFIREAQRADTNPPIYPESSQNDSPGPRNTPQPQDAYKGVRPYNLLLNDLMTNYNNGYFDQFYKEYQDNNKFYQEDEQGYLKRGVDRVLQQRAKEKLPNPAASQTAVPITPTITPTITPQSSFSYKNTGYNYNPTGYRTPTTTGQGVVAGDPTTQFTFNSTGGNYNPQDYRDPNSEINDPYDSKKINEQVIKNINPNTTNVPEAASATQAKIEPELTEEQKREEYFRKSKEESTQLENKAIASRMKPQIIEAMRSGDILKAQSILTDYKLVFTRDFIKEIQKTIDRMNPKTYGIDRSDKNANALTKYLYRLLQNRSKKAFDGIESKFDSFNIKPDDKVKFIYFRNNLKDIVGELFDPYYLNNLPQ
jgi:hypothetical protein